jgi:hypothetical protein
MRRFPALGCDQGGEPVILLISRFAGAERRRGSQISSDRLAHAKVTSRSNNWKNANMPSSLKNASIMRPPS